MKIGLIDVDGHNFPNLALMKLSAWHKAQGEAKELEIRAQAQADYNRKVAASLTPTLVQSKMIEKWDGKLPVYGTAPNLFKDVK